MKKPLLVLSLLVTASILAVPPGPREESQSPEERLRENARAHMPRALDPDSTWARFILWLDSMIGRG